MEKKVLIVDDSSIIRSSLASALPLISTHTLQIVGHASDGEEGVALFEQLRPDIVTMDLDMPKMDGNECIRQIMEIDPDVAIIVVSRLASSAHGMKALELGAKYVLDKKDLDVSALCDALNEVTQT